MTKNEIEKRYRMKHPEKQKEKLKRYYQKNKEKIRKQQNDYHKKYYHSGGKDIMRERTKKWENETKKKVMFHYSNGEIKCAICGEKDIDVLTIDHIYGGGNRIRTEILKSTASGMHTYRYLIKKGFPEGYRVLCFNCNHKERLRLGFASKKSTDKQLEKYGFYNKNQQKLVMENKEDQKTT